jgi:hypothetical protein
MRRPVKRVNPVSRRTAAITVVLVACAAAGTGAALAVSSAPPNPGPVPPLARTHERSAARAAQAGQTVQAVEAPLAGSFAVMRRQLRAADAVPGSIPVALSQASGASLALARRVPSEGGVEAWVIPGRNTACILAVQPEHGLGGAVCTSAAAAAAGELNVQAANSSLPGVELLAGVVPDGVGSVGVHLADGSAATLPVREDAYVSMVHGAVSSIAAAGPSGPLTIPTMSAGAPGG